MGVITFNNVTSSSLGIEVETFPDYVAPEKEYQVTHVPGRNGDLIVDTKTYKNVPRPYGVSMVVEPPARSASGSIASISTSKQESLGKCKCNLNYDSNGYTAVKITNKGTNVWDEQWESGSLDINTGEPVTAADWGRSKNFFAVFPGSTYYGVISHGEMYVLEYDKGQNYLGRYQAASNQTFTVGSSTYYLKFYTNDTYGTTYNNDISINYPSTITTYVPQIDGSTTTVDLSGITDTIYGGELDVINGIVKSTKDSSGSDLSSPKYYMIDKNSIMLSVGSNNVWCDSGDINIETRGLGTFTEKMNAIAEWLHSASGYARLEDTYEPDHYRMAYYSESLSIENLFNEAGKATLNFVCKPQRYLKSGETPVTFTAAGIIQNGTGFASSPILKVTTNNTQGSVSIGNHSITIKAGAGTDPITIDCELQDAWSGTTNKNSYIVLTNGEFPTIDPGIQTVTFDGGVQSVEVTPRWWTV